MNEITQNKIVHFQALLEIVESLKKEGKVIVQSHGVFDLIHPGIIKHLSDASGQGDILIVTVIRDQDVRRGPGRPIFPEQFRAENVASLGQVDYVCVVDDENPFECIQLLSPDVFAKGQAYKERDRLIHSRIFEEEKEFYFGNSRIYETNGFSISSSQIINQFLDLYPEDTKFFLNKFLEKYSFDDIAGQINTLQNMNVLVIGDGIVDEYHYCEPMGKAGKTNLVVNRYLSHEIFAGGAFAIANHVSGICRRAHLVTLLGAIDPRDKFVSDNMRPNVDCKFFFRKDAPTVVKKRYVHQYLNQKLFEVNFINDTSLEQSLEDEVIEYLESIIDQYDLVLVSDFGHGFISEKIYQMVKNKAKVVAVNTQTNAANSGYNLITKYSKPSFVCLDEAEVRLAAQKKYAGIDVIAREMRERIQADHLIVTLGKKGSLGIDKDNKILRTPVFSTKVIDTIGAGDAFFAYTAPCFAQGMPLDLVSFIGNAVGALAVQIVCNKKPVEKHELLEFVHFLLK